MIAAAMELVADLCRDTAPALGRIRASRRALSLALTAAALAQTTHMVTVGTDNGATTRFDPETVTAAKGGTEEFVFSSFCLLALVC